MCKKYTFAFKDPTQGILEMFKRQKGEKNPSDMLQRCTVEVLSSLHRWMSGTWVNLLCNTGICYVLEAQPDLKLTSEQCSLG